MVQATVGIILLLSISCDAWTLQGGWRTSSCWWQQRDRRNLAPSSSSSSSALLLYHSNHQILLTPLLLDRRKMGAVVASTLLIPFVANAAEQPPDAATTTTTTEDDNNNAAFADIAERAQRISKQVDATRPASTNSMILATNKTAYDFSLPISGTAVSFQDMIHQSFVELPTSSNNNNNNEQINMSPFRDGKIKAILVVNIKQDDPVARKDIPELMTLATRYQGAVAIVACPTDQGYYEPDTSQLLRLKLASEYGYGINPNTIVTDKVNVLGSSAHPFWRWLQSTCRTPYGLGRLQGNFEKFLVDGRTGLPVRRYPRKYRPLNMANDIEALLVNKPLPPAGANYLEEWRTAATEAQTNTYRFEKGLNYFD